MAIVTLEPRRNRGRWSVIAASLLVTATSPILSASVQQPQVVLRHPPISLQRAPVFQPDRPGTESELHSLDVEFEVNPGVEGVLIVGGDEAERFILYVRAGRVVWNYQGVFQDKADIVSTDLPTGWVRVHYEFDAEQGVEQGRHRNGRMFVNGKLVGQIRDSECSAAIPQADSQSEKNTRAETENVTPEFSFTGKVRTVAIHRAAAP